MAAAARRAIAWALVATTIATGHGDTTAANASAVNTSALFARIFNVECLENMGDEAALEDAQEYVSGHLRDLRVDANFVAALHFIGLIVAMEMGEVPDPVGTNPISVIVFCIWITVQAALVITQAFSIVFVVLSYLSMKEHFGECLVSWRGSAAVLHLVTGLSGPLVPAVLQKLMFIKVAIMATTQGLGAVGLKTARQALIYGVSVPFDTILACLTLMTLTASLLTGAFVFIVPILPIPCDMLFLSGYALAVVYFVLNGTQYMCDCLYRTSEATDDEEEKGREEPNAEYRDSVEWINKGSNLPKNFQEAKSALLLARSAVPRFAYLALFAMAIAPVVLFSTWLAWQAYDGRHSTEDMAAMLFEVYDFSCASWLEHFEMPSIFSLLEVVDLTPEGFLSMIVELNDFEFIPPGVLLKRSRLLSLLSVPLAVVKTIITALQKILALCLPESSGIFTKKVSEGASATELRNLGFSAADLWRKGFPAAELKGAGFSAAELKRSGFAIAELKREGFSSAELKRAGFSAAEFKTAGFSHSEIRAVGFSLKEAGFSAAELKEEGFSAAELKNNDFSAAELRRAGFAIAELQREGFSAAELKQGGFPAAEFKTLGFSHSEITALGFSAAELKEAGISAAELRREGISAEDLKEGGFSAAELKRAGIAAAELRREGFSAEDLKEGGFTAAELKEAGFSAVVLRAVNFSGTELIAAGFSSAELTAAGFS